MFFNSFLAIFMGNPSLRLSEVLPRMSILLSTCLISDFFLNWTDNSMQSARRLLDIYFTYVNTGTGNYEHLDHIALKK